MKSVISLLIALLPLSAFAEGIIVKNGAGFTEFLLMRTQTELVDRWDEIARTNACAAPVNDVFRSAADSLRRQPAELRFAEPTEYQTLARQPGVLRSPIFPVLAQPGQAALWVDHMASLAWTAEVTALSVLTEGHLLRLGVAPNLRQAALACVNGRARLRYVSTDLKAYRQPGVGALIGPESRLLVTDSEGVKDIANLEGCGTRPVIGMTTTALQGAQQVVRWTLNLQVAPNCVMKFGRALIVTMDFVVTVGNADAFLAGDRRVQLKLARQNVQSQR